MVSLDDWRRKAAAGNLPAGLVLYKQFVPEVKVATDERRVTFTISTASVDREGDTVAVDGWQLENYLKNPVVLFAHRYDQLPIARAVSVSADGNALKAVAEFPEPGLHPLADTVYEMLKGGFLRATSVGFRPLKTAHNEERPGWAMDFLEQELLEFSVVPVPSNPEALMEMAKGLAGAAAAGIDLDPLAEAVRIAKTIGARARRSTKKDVPVDAAGARVAVRRAFGSLSLVKDGQALTTDENEQARSAIEAIEDAAETLETLLGLDDDEEPDDDDEKGYAARLRRLEERTLKGGRVLSAENLKLVKQALEHCEAAADHHKNLAVPIDGASKALKALIEKADDAGDEDDDGELPDGNTQPDPDDDGDQPADQGKSFVIASQDLAPAYDNAVSTAVSAATRAAFGQRE